MYRVYYISSNGQPANGLREFTNREEALRQARAYDGSLLRRSGGCSVCREHRGTKVRNLRVWNEGAEGGFFSATPKYPGGWDIDIERSW
jgi:hypothetical protein